MVASMAQALDSRLRSDLHTPRNRNHHPPEIHQNTFKLIAGCTEMLQVDNYLCDLRKIAHRSKLLGYTLTDVVGQQTIE
jgi:hypothetical protein